MARRINTAAERNSAMREFLNGLYSMSTNPNTVVNENAYKEDLDIVFNTKNWGFREVLLTVIVALKFDPAFKASEKFYDCNPRGIFGGPIKDFLDANNFPHHKDGPLNVAKAAVGLNEAWAAQRRPKEVAGKVIQLINFLESNLTEIDNVAISLIRRYIDATENLANLAVEIDPVEDPAFLHYLCTELITKTPDGGNTPQKIAALLLKCYHECLQTGIEVTGGDDRASTTNTTSKKAGDINEERNGQIYKVYEITVKSFDEYRIADSYDSIRTYNENHNTNIAEIIVICREEDCPSDIRVPRTRTFLGCCSYQNIMYYYLEIFDWINITLLHMTIDGRRAFHQMLNDYINEINTAESVKVLWRMLHTPETDNGSQV